LPPKYTTAVGASVLPMRQIFNAASVATSPSPTSTTGNHSTAAPGTNAAGVSTVGKYIMRRWLAYRAKPNAA